MTRHIANTREMGNLYTSRILVGKPEGKRPLVEPRRIQKNNSKMILKEMCQAEFDWLRMLFLKGLL
jgi:hypothetical protein